MKIRLIGIVLFIFILVSACQSGPESRSQDGPGSSGTSGNFDPKKVTQQEYVSTIEDVRVFIDEINGIIAAGNYRVWREKLSPEYFTRISSPEFLAEVSEMPIMKRQNFVLKTAEDYFRRVVIPSRANSRVDDIEFIGRNKVTAYTINSRTGARNILYDLERKDNSWIIIN